MDNILALSVRQIRLFPPDTLPLVALTSAAGGDAIRQRCGFRDLPIFEGGDWFFTSGLTLIEEGGTPIPINFFQFGPQKIAIDVAADSATASRLYGMLAGLLAQLGGRQEIATAEPIVMVEETQCVARLAFSWEDLVSPEFAAFMHGGEGVARLNSAYADARISALNLRFTIQYEAKDLRFKEYGVTFQDKALTIEPRKNLPLAENMFFTASPLDSESHLQLIRDLEHAIAGKRRPPRRRLRQ